MKMICGNLMVFFLFISTLAAQEPMALAADFHKARREALRAKMPPNTVAVFFANPIRNRSNDVDYPYHQDPDFYYLSGIKEPNAVLLIFKDKQVGVNGNSNDEMLFVQPRNKKVELWNGARLGPEGAKEVSGIENTWAVDEFKALQPDWSLFDKVYGLPFNEASENKGGTEIQLVDLQQAFKEAIGYPTSMNPSKKEALYRLIAEADEKKDDGLLELLRYYWERDQDLQQDSVLMAYFKDQTRGIKKEKKQQYFMPLPPHFDQVSLNGWMGELREIKTPLEIRLLERAVAISVMGQIEAMKAIKPGISEREVQAIQEFVFKKYGAQDVGYPSIVGAADNGCVLHYIENEDRAAAGTLILMDIGAEYQGYTADVTRTIPVSGRFSEAQKTLYDLVLKAQDAGIAAARVGANFWETDRAARNVIEQGLQELGIARTQQEARLYFPHGTSHYLGLDVHDRGTYGRLQAGSIITVEPGIYIPTGSNCDPKWWGIGIRIEDDILITEKGPVVLSADATRTVEEIERMMALPSALDDFVLPEIKGN